MCFIIEKQQHYKGIGLKFSVNLSSYEVNSGNICGTCWFIVSHCGWRLSGLPDMLWLFHYVGVESPSHAIRADADPLARSATSIVITLADKYTYDCPVNILIYPSGRWTH